MPSNSYIHDQVMDQNAFRRELNNLKDKGDPPCAYLFCNGNAIYFDENGEQIQHLQQNGLCGLHRFIGIYPEAPIFWSVWREHAHKISKEMIPYLLTHFRMSPSEYTPGDTDEPRNT